MVEVAVAGAGALVAGLISADEAEAVSSVGLPQVTINMVSRARGNSGSGFLGSVMLGVL
jgi:hypothetical protein